MVARVALEYGEKGAGGGDGLSRTLLSEPRQYPPADAPGDVARRC
jgi:hypothetical protein